VSEGEDGQEHRPGAHVRRRHRRPRAPAHDAAGAVRRRSRAGCASTACVARTVNLKYRDEDFQTSTRAQDPGGGRRFRRRAVRGGLAALPGVHGRRKVRLLGVSASGLAGPAQMPLFVPRPSRSDVARGPGRAALRRGHAHAREPARWRSPRTRTGAATEKGRETSGGNGPGPERQPAAAPVDRPPPSVLLAAGALLPALGRHRALHPGLAALDPARRLAGRTARPGRRASWRTLLAEATRLGRATTTPTGFLAPPPAAR
jgi:hypothetical protein